MNFSNDQQFRRELIILKSGNYQNDGQTFTFNFGRPVDFKKGSTIMIQSCNMYNSTFNITSAYNNNTFSIAWLGQTLQIVIPDGYYSYDEINALIEYYLIQNDWYYVFNNVAIYPISVLENAPRYKGQININPIPSQAQATSNSYILPTGATWTFPSTPQTPQVTLSSGLGKIFGFSKNLVFPPTIQTSAYSYVSDITPIVSPIYSYIITCNMINTDISPFNNNVLGQIPINNSFGGLISYNTYVNFPIDVHPSKYNQLVIKFLDQDLNNIFLNDPEITLILAVTY